MRMIILLLTTLFCFSAYADVTNFKSKGSLESQSPIGCTDISGLSNKNTPADIFVGVTDCIENDKYENASQLYLTAFAYGSYDSKRVEDKTASQAIPALRFKHFSKFSKDELTKLQAALKEEKKNMDSICSFLKKLGKPDYHPDYMIQHGMGAFLGNKSKNGLIPNFDSEKAWNDVLYGYVKCPS